MAKGSKNPLLDLSAVRNNLIGGPKSKINKRKDLTRKRKELLFRQANKKIFELVSVAGVENILKKSQEEVKKVLLEVSMLDRDTVPSSSIRRQQTSFYVTINMNQFGKRRIRQLLFSKGRPPTNYTISGGKGQGSHIVAYSLLVAAFQGQLAGVRKDETDGAELEPLAENDDSKNDAIQRLINLYDKLTALGLPPSVESEKKIRDGFEGLEKRRNAIPTLSLQRFILQSPNFDNLRENVRKKLSELRQILSIVIEEITKLWNKREGVVYAFSKEGKFKQSLIFGADITGRENSTLSRVREIDEISGQLSALEIENSEEDEAEITLLNYAVNLSGDEKRVNMVLSRLIDIRPPEEFIEQIIIQQYGPLKGANFKELKRKHDEIFKKATKDAAALGKLAYPSLKDKISEENIQKYMKEAVSEDLHTRVQTLEAKETPLTIVESARLHRYKLRLEVLGASFVPS